VIREGRPVDDCALGRSAAARARFVAAGRGFPSARRRYLGEGMRRGEREKGRWWHCRSARNRQSGARNADNGAGDCLGASPRRVCLQKRDEKLLSVLVPVLVFRPVGELNSLPRSEQQASIIGRARPVLGRLSEAAPRVWRATPRGPYSVYQTGVGCVGSIGGRDVSCKSWEVQRGWEGGWDG